LHSWNILVVDEKDITEELGRFRLKEAMMGAVDLEKILAGEPAS
jgi:hypothetical protein